MYDIVIVGGGMGGATLGRSMAQQGARVLIVERERQFTDRVRGEGLASWGGAEAQRPGIYDLLHNSCGFEKRWSIGLGPDRDLVTTTPQHMPLMTFSHPKCRRHS
jgi:menaquinone-9 beta-reductase